MLSILERGIGSEEGFRPNGTT